MTRIEKVKAASDWLIKILMAVCTALVTVGINVAADEMQELKKEIRLLREESRQIQISNVKHYSDIQIKLVSLGIRLESHEKETGRQ